MEDLWSGVFHLLKFVGDFFILKRTHITRFGEGKINKLGPAAGTQSRETSSCWGWVYSFRLVTRKAQSSDRGALFSSQKIPLDPEKLTLSEASSQELLQFCLWLFFKARKFTMTWSAMCQHCSSQCWTVLPLNAQKWSRLPWFTEAYDTTYLQCTSDKGACW